IFLINIPLGLIGIILVHLYIPETFEKRYKLDFGGMIIFMITAFSLVQGILTLFKGELIGGILIVVAFFCGVIFILTEIKHPAPMIPVEILRHKTIFTGIISSFLCYMVYYSVVFLMPFYYQDVLLFESDQSGILMVVPPFAMAIMGPFAGFFAERIDAKRSTSFGAIMLSFFVLMIAFLFYIFPRNSYEIIFILVPLVALSAGSLTTFTVSNGTSVMNVAPKGDVSVVTGLIGLSRNIGFALGTTISSSLFTLFFLINNPNDVTSGMTFISSYYTSLGQTYILFSLFALSAAIISYLRSSDKRVEKTKLIS
ncbi:MAG: MFS transporter, partial [Promethearchaeota archaeon]